MPHLPTRCVARLHSTRLAIASAAASVLLSPLAAHAATEYWKVASGNWNIAGNWSNAANLTTAGAVPVAGDTADIWNNDATSRTITLNTNVTSALAVVEHRQCRHRHGHLRAGQL